MFSILPFCLPRSHSSVCLPLSLFLWGDSRTHDLPCVGAAAGESSSSDARGVFLHLDQFLHINEMWLGLDSSRPRLLCLHYWNSLPHFLPLLFLSVSSAITWMSHPWNPTQAFPNRCVKYTQPPPIKMESPYLTVLVCVCCLCFVNKIPFMSIWFGQAHTRRYVYFTFQFRGEMLVIMIALVCQFQTGEIFHCRYSPREGVNTEHIYTPCLIKAGKPFPPPTLYYKYYQAIQRSSRPSDRNKSYPR